MTRIDTADYTAMQSQKKRLSDGQVEPVSSPDSEYSHGVGSICKLLTCLFTKES